MRDFWGSLRDFFNIFQKFNVPQYLKIIYFCYKKFSMIDRSIEGSVSCEGFCVILPN